MAHWSSTFFFGTHQRLYYFQSGFYSWQLVYLWSFLLKFKSFLVTASSVSKQISGMPESCHSKYLMWTSIILLNRSVTDIALRPYYTMRCFTGVFYFSSRKNTRKLPNARKMRENVSILHYKLGKNASQLGFSRFFLAFLLTNLTKTQTQRTVSTKTGRQLSTLHE